MKTRVVSSKDLDINCWSALRYCDSCEDCDKVDKCKLEEGKRGRLRKTAKKIIEAEEFQSTFDKLLQIDLITMAQDILKLLDKTRHLDIKKS